MIDLNSYLKTRVRVEHPFGFLWGELESVWKEPGNFFVRSNCGYAFFHIDDVTRLIEATPPGLPDADLILRIIIGGK
jgi:hypothetical protein